MVRGGCLIVVVLTLLMLPLRIQAQRASGVLPDGLDAPQASSQVAFLENRGQIRDTRGALRPDILYTASANGATIFLRASGFSYVFRRPAAGGDSALLYRMDMEFVDPTPLTSIVPSGQTGPAVTFYRPAPAGTVTGAVTGVRSFGELVYHDIYPHIDFVVRGDGSRLKYEFVVNPGGDPSRILLRYRGATSLAPTSDRGVRIATPLGWVEEGKPYSYQGPQAQRVGPHGEQRGWDDVTVRSDYIVTDEMIGFDVDDFDRTRPLVIDPLLTWSTYLGGSLDESGPTGAGATMAVDRGGNILVATSTFSLNFPATVGAFQGSIAAAGASDVAISKLDRNGRLLWATYYGGTAEDIPGGVGVDGAGNVVVGGTTRSSDFPVTSPSFQSRYQGSGDCFLVSLDAAGARRWATYFGGTAEEQVGAVAVDSAGSVVLAGSTRSNGIATPGVFQTLRGGGSADAFVALFTSGGSRLWATYAGGTSDDVARAVALDAAGSVLLAGETASSDFPVSPGAYRRTAPNGGCGFLMQLSASGAATWSTYFGGGGGDRVQSIATAPNGDAVLCGVTASNTFPTTAGAYLRSAPGGDDGFVARFSTAGALKWSTYLGGSSADNLLGVVVDTSGRSVVLGYSESTNFPVTADALVRTRSGARDAVIAKLDTLGRPIWSTYLGGTGAESAIGGGISGSAIVVYGVTASSDFPITQGATQGRLGGGTDLFLATLCDLHPMVVASASLRFCDGDSITLSVPNGYRAYRWSTGATSPSIVAKTGDRFWVWVDDGLCTGYSDTVTTTLFPRPTVTILPGAIATICEGDSVTLEATAGYASYRWSSGQSTRRITVGRSGRYTVTVANENDCIASVTSEVIVKPRTKPRITGGPLVICDGDSAVLEADPGFMNYVWSSGGTSQRIVVRAPGTYTVTVMNSFGCPATSDPITVTVHPRPTARVTPLGPTLFCEGDRLPLQAPAGARSYLWSTGETTRTIEVTSSGSYSVTVTDSNGCGALSPAVTVRAEPRPRPVIVPDRPLRFCEGDSIILDAGGTYRSYLWSSGERTRQIVARRTGRFAVTVANDIGCLATSDSIAVVVDPLPVIAIQGPSSVCAGAEQRYDVPPGYVVEWSVEGGGGQIIGPANASTVTIRWGAVGEGTVRVSAHVDPSGCASSAALKVSIGNGLVPVVIGDRPLRLCGVDSLTLDAGPGYASYRWSTGETTRTILARTPGAYWVDVSDNFGCSGRSGVVNVLEGLEKPPVVTASNGTAICAGDRTVLDAGPGYASYLWSDGRTGRTIEVRDSGVYQVTVTSREGCVGVSQPVRVVVRPAPDATVYGPRIVCRRSTIVYSAAASPGVAYDWRVTGGDLVAGQGGTDATVTWQGDGIGRVLLTVRSLDGCVATTSLEVTIGDRLEPSIRAVGGTKICAGERALLDAGAGYDSYRWSNGDSSRTILVEKPGTFTVTVVDANGCGGVSQPVTVEVLPLPVAEISPAGPIIICEGDSVTLSAVAGASFYRWSTGAGTPVIVVRSAGSYTVTAASSDGCTATSAPVEVIVLPRPATPVIVVTGDTLSAAEPASRYQWSRNGVPISGGTGRAIRLGEPGGYTLTVGEECTATSAPFHLLAQPAMWLDTVTADVGKRFRLAFKARPALTPEDSVTGYSVRLRIDPHSLFLHGVIDHTARVGETGAVMSRGRDGMVTVERVGTGAFITGSMLFELEMEGLSTGVPVNDVQVESVTLLGRGMPKMTADGMVLLNGCDIGSGFQYGRRVRISSVRPNPIAGEATIIYRAPVGVEPELRLLDIVGREVLSQRLAPGTDQEQSAELHVATVPSGVYRLELRDRAEMSAMPIVIQK